MYHLRRFLIFVLVVLLIVFLTSVLPRVLDPTPPDSERQLADRRWIDSSPYFLDRQACRWVGLCGLHHLRWDDPTVPRRGAGGGSDGGGDDGGELRLELRSLGVGDDEAGRLSWEYAGSRGTPSNATAATASGKLRDVPQYVLDFAPLVHLCSGENFWPSDIAEHVRHVRPSVDGHARNLTDPLTLDNLHLLNAERGEVMLDSDVDVETRPEWLLSNVGIPEPFPDDDEGDDDGAGDGPKEPEGSWPRPRPHHPHHDGEAGRPIDGTTWYEVGRDHPVHRISDPRKFHSEAEDDLVQRLLQRHNVGKQHIRRGASEPPPAPVQEPANFPRHYKPDSSGFSRGPAVLVMVDKGSGILDAFWFFFYSYNLGQTVLGARYGNHVGDWEHCMVRFEDGVPRGIFFSEHEGGQAYAFEAVEKKHGRPVIYSAVGSHAMYPLPGDHPYVLPFKMLKDVTDRGPLWDPAKNIYAYHFDPSLPDPEDPREEPASLAPAASNPDAPTSWFHYAGSWGDELLPLADRRQWRIFGQYHYVRGPQGPKFKKLDREKVCQSDRCRILYSLKPGQTWYG